MSRTLNDDFDEDDVPSGGLDLETGSHVGGSGVSSNYQGDGTIDFDDDLSSDEGTGGALELDMPPGPESNRFSGKPPGQGSVPDLALPPPAKSSGSLPAGRTSGSHPAADLKQVQHKSLKPEQIAVATAHM